jgi:hypothetical protein
MLHAIFFLLSISLLHPTAAAQRFTQMERKFLITFCKMQIIQVAVICGEVE